MVRGTKKCGGTKRRGTQKGGKKWSMKYKNSIDCNHPKGFSQKQHCKYGRRTRKKGGKKHRKLTM